MSTFVIDYPYLDMDKNRRLGYRLRIRSILPEYMKGTDFFNAFYDTIDEVFDKRIYDKTHFLSSLRNMWLSNPTIEQKIDYGELLDLEDWSLPQNEIVVKQLNLLGLQFGESASLFSNKDFISFCRFLGMYWFEKGTQTFMDFVNFCCGTNFVLVNMWTEDYVNFYEEGDEAIGTPLWEGGSWYPTTHITFVSKDGATNILALFLLFKEIANYNLVLDSIRIEFNMDITDGIDPSGGEDSSKWGRTLKFSLPYSYHTSFHIHTYDPEEEVKRQIFGFLGSYRYNFDNSIFGDNMGKFQEGYGTVYIENSTGGYVTAYPNGKVPPGTEVRVDAYPDGKYELLEITWNNNVIKNGTNFVMPQEDVVVSASFNRLLLPDDVIYNIQIEISLPNNSTKAVSISLLRENTEEKPLEVKIQDFLKEENLGYLIYEALIDNDNIVIQRKERSIILFYKELPEIIPQESTVLIDGIVTTI